MSQHHRRTAAHQVQQRTVEFGSGETGQLHPGRFRSGRLAVGRHLAPHPDHTAQQGEVRPGRRAPRSPAVIATSRASSHRSVRQASMRQDQPAMGRLPRLGHALVPRHAAPCLPDRACRSCAPPSSMAARTSSVPAYSAYSTPEAARSSPARARSAPMTAADPAVRGQAAAPRGGEHIPVGPEQRSVAAGGARARRNRSAPTFTHHQRLHRGDGLTRGVGHQQRDRVLALRAQPHPAAVRRPPRTGSPR
ncbi:hypothetical protein SANTM175S_03765 [Streptomyces antimycoticus]